MHRFCHRRAFVTGLLFWMAWQPSAAPAQPKSSQQQLVGTWKYVSVDIVRADGSRVPLFGQQPSGLAVFDRSGHYLLFTARSDQPRFASNSRMTGTDDENRAVVHGSIAHFGLYAVDEREKTITFRIETSSFPNWNGAEQKRPFTLSGDELKWTTAASTGGTAEVVLKRVR
jgi:Lipocalin-like domain